MAPLLAMVADPEDLVVSFERVRDGRGDADEERRQKYSLFVPESRP